VSVELDRAEPRDLTTGSSEVQLPPVRGVGAPHPLLGELFAELDQAETRWLVLRGELELAAPTGDVDLLVEQDGLPRVEAILRAAGFVPMPTAGRGSHRIHVGYDDRDGTWIKLDLVTQLGFGPYFALVAPLAADCLARRRMVGGVPVLDADDAFWTLLLHCALDSRAVPDRHGQRLQALSAEASGDSQWATVVFPRPGDRSRAASLLSWAAAGSWSTTLRHAPALERGWLRGQHVAARRRRLVGRLARRLEPVQAFLRRPGRTVALLGPDGAGKSVLASEIARTFPFPVRSVYMGLWRRPGRVERPLLPGLDLLARLLFAWRAYLVGRYHRALGRLVIFDRYVHDARVDARHGHPLRDRLYFGLLGRALPPPDLVVILDVPGDVAYARKGEHDVAGLESRRQAYLSLGKAVRGAQIVDADRPLSVVLIDVTARIWQRYRSGSRR